MRKILVSLAALLCLSASGASPVSIQVNGTTVSSGGTVFVTPADSVIVQAQAATRWFLITPVLREYTNLGKTAIFSEAGFAKIDYSAAGLGTSPELNLSPLLRTRGPGTFYIAWGEINTQNLSGSEPLHRKFANIVQIACRRDSSYTGLLEELSGTPFVWAPQRIQGSWQEDERVGSDCASFAIYGRRRMGYDIPYCGPKKIMDYLDRLTPELSSPGGTSSGEYRSEGGAVSLSVFHITRGAVLHFGSHVAVFYEDRGSRGFLDEDDLVINSIGITPHICAVEDTGYFDLPLTVYRWKER